MPKNSFNFSIADVFFNIESNYTFDELDMHHRYGAYQSELQNNIFSIFLKISRVDDIALPKGEIIYSLDSSCKIYKNGEIFYVVFKNILNNLICSIIQTNRNWDNIEFYERKDGKSSMINTSAGDLLFRTSILNSGGLVLHASFIKYKNKGIVFVGHSREGKSTQAKLWCDLTEATLINEDRVAVRFNGIIAECFGIPWSGSSNISKNDKSRLSALILLKKSSFNKIEMLSAANAAILVLSRSFLPYWDANLMSMAVSNVDQILKNVPIYLLHCRPDAEAVSVVHSVL